MKNLVKIISIILVVTLIVGVVGLFSGCSNETENEKTLSRAAWIDILATQYNLHESDNKEPFFDDVKSSNPYFPEIQACTEWKIIENSEEFKPDDDATNEFAVITAIKAIGIARLEKSDYKVSLKTDAEILSFFKAQSGLDLDVKKALTVNRVEEIIEKTQAISDGMTLPQVHNVDYKDNVREMNLNQVIFSADGKTATIKSGTANIGDIIVVEPNEYLPDGKYVKVTSSNNGQVSYVDAKIDEITDKYEVSGSYDPRVLAVRPLSSGITVTQIGGTPAIENQSNIGNSSLNYIPMSVTNNKPEAIQLANTYKDAGKIEFSIGKTFEGKNGKITITGTISVNFDKVTIDYGDWIWSPWDGYRDSYLRIDDTFQASITVSGNYSQSIPLAEVGIGVPGIGLSADLSLNIGLDGTASVSVSVKTSEEITIPPYRAAKFKVSKGNPVVTSHLDAHLWVRPDLCASVKILGHKVAKVGVYSGIEAKVVMDATHAASGTESCMDLKAWVPLVVYYGYDFIITKGDDRVEIWTENNSVWKKHTHIEDGKIVEKCTRTGATTNPDGEPAGDGEEGGLGDRPQINTSLESKIYLDISSYYVALNPNTTDTLIVTSIPAGYTANDLVFTSDKPDIVSVNNAGALSAEGEGSAMIKVATSDGEFEQYCAIFCRVSFAVEFSPLT